MLPIACSSILAFVATGSPLRAQPAPVVRVVYPVATMAVGEEAVTMIPEEELPSVRAWNVLKEHANALEVQVADQQQQLAAQGIKIVSNAAVAAGLKAQVKEQEFALAKATAEQDLLLAQADANKNVREAAERALLEFKSRSLPALVLFGIRRDGIIATTGMLMSLITKSLFTAIAGVVKLPFRMLGATWRIVSGSNRGRPTMTTQSRSRLLKEWAMDNLPAAPKPKESSTKNIVSKIDGVVVPTWKLEAAGLAA